MQILNRKVFRSVFIVLLIGMAPVALAIGIWAVVWPPAAVKMLVIIGSVSYVVGVFFVTMFGNVPKNEKLAAMPDGSADAQSYWPRYYSGWMFWNHVRTGSSFLTAVCYVAAAINLAMAI